MKLLFALLVLLAVPCAGATVTVNPASLFNPVEWVGPSSVIMVSGISPQASEVAITIRLKDLTQVSITIERWKGMNILWFVFPLDSSKVLSASVVEINSVRPMPKWLPRIEETPTQN